MYNYIENNIHTLLNTLTATVQLDNFVSTAIFISACYFNIILNYIFIFYQNAQQNFISPSKKLNRINNVFGAMFWVPATN